MPLHRRKAMSVTPVGSQLKARLEDRMVWFNGWFFKWHHIGGSGAVEIETFDGRSARYAGLRFDGSPLEVYWYAIARGARKEVIDQLDWVERRVARYERSVALAAIDETAELLTAFVSSLRDAAVEKDRVLRGNGIEFPPHRDAGTWPGTSATEISLLAADLKRALFPDIDNALATPPAPKRKVAVVFVADVVGYSQLTSRDEAQTVSQVRMFKAELLEPSLSRHHGRLFNTGGDSFHIEFSSSVVAMECWLEVLRQLKEVQTHVPVTQRLRFRTGMHLGEVLAEGSNLLGDTVNVASRLQSIAEPDSLCISASVFEQIATRTKLLAFRDIGLQSLKNMLPMRAYLANFSQDQTGNPPTSSTSASRESRALEEPTKQLAVFSSSNSDRLAALSVALARDCPDGLGRKSYSIEDIQNLLPQVPQAELEDMVYELEAEGLVALAKYHGGSWHLRVSANFYEFTDSSVMGWTTTNDARRLAEEALLQNSGQASRLHATSGWSHRRFNPAFRYLLDQLPSNFVSKERSALYPAATFLMQPEVRATLRKMLRDT